jgi:hypothetical protein
MSFIKLNLKDTSQICSTTATGMTSVNLFRGNGSVLRKPGSGAVLKRTDEIVVNNNGKCTKNIFPPIESPN